LINLEEYLKKYNIRISLINPRQKKIEIKNINLDIIINKRFYDLKLLLKKHKIDVYQFYIEGLGSISNDLKILEIKNYIDQAKIKNTIEGQLITAFNILKDSNYYEIDWYLRIIKKILLKIDENNIHKLSEFLNTLKNTKKDLYIKTINLIKDLKENNKVLNTINCNV
jgi:hypothetical protein